MIMPTRIVAAVVLGALFQGSVAQTLQSYPDNPRMLTECSATRSANISAISRFISEGDRQCAAQYDLGRQTGAYMRCRDPYYRNGDAARDADAGRYESCKTAFSRREQWEKEQQDMARRNEERALDAKRAQAQALQDLQSNKASAANEARRQLSQINRAADPSPARANNSAQNLGAALRIIGEMARGSSNYSSSKAEDSVKELGKDSLRVQREVQKATGTDSVVAGIQRESLKNITEIQRNAARDFDAAASSISDLSSLQAAATPSRINMRASPDPALRADPDSPQTHPIQVSSLDGIAAERGNSPSIPTSPSGAKVASSLDELSFLAEEKAGCAVPGSTRTVAHGSRIDVQGVSMSCDNGTLK
jgi:hypothetical protein